MFTGLIEGQGRIESMEKRGGDVLFRFHPLFAWDSPEIGESVACNGVCLTMETWIPSGPSFTAFASAETLSCSNLGGLAVGGLVNMERAMAMGERFGGHIVSGHVDTVARVESVRPVGDSRRIRLVFDEAWSLQIVPKGSVTLDGIGTLSPALGLKKGREREEPDGSGTRRNATSIEVNDVHFRVDKELVREVNRHCRLERSSTQRRLYRSKYTPEERLALALRFLEEHPFMRVGEYAALTGLSQTTAGQELRRWAQTEGSGIDAKGVRSHRVYVREK